MERTTTLQMLDRFSDAIEAAGVERVPAALLNDLVAAARTVDASPIAIAVLVDPTEPAVVRERAFGKVSAQVVGRVDSVVRTDPTFAICA